MNQVITIISRDAIMVTNSQGKTLSGWEWDGRSLRHPQATWTATPEMAARITRAVTEAVPARTERLGGLDVAKLPESERAGWEWDGRMDGNGRYARSFPGHAVTITYVPADFGR